jgi:hypothetical protein
MDNINIDNTLKLFKNRVHVKIFAPTNYEEQNGENFIIRSFINRYTVRNIIK